MAVAQKVYDFPLAKVEDQLVSFLKQKRGESTVADMIAGTGLPKYQVEQAAKAALDEYAGRLKVTESGELLYYFPSGMRSTVRGAGPGFRRFWKSFKSTAARVFTLLFKIWIVAMLVGYFVAFVALGVLAILASIAASVAGRGDGRDSGRGRGGGFGGMYLVMQLFNLILRMWFWSSILNDRQRKPQPGGRAFYKSVFGFVFGDEDPNRGWEDVERRYIIGFIRSRRGVISLEELMALTGRENDAANALMNRLLLEYEGEPGVTDDGTVVYSFPELMRSADPAQKAMGQVPVFNPGPRVVVPFSANKPRTNGWIIFFNAFNLAFGLYFLGISVAQGVAALSRTGPYLYSFVGHLLLQAGISPVPVLEVVLGIIPVAFSVFFFLVPFVRRIRLGRQNDALREQTVRKRVMAQILASPSHVDARELRPIGTNLDPRDLSGTSRRILDRIAAALKAEPVPLEKEGIFAYRFPELERELADLEAFRRGIDIKRYDVGKTVFDSGK
ncbi:MAG: hypothetical protein ABSG21_05290 [Spirochaetia bacterium]